MKETMKALLYAGPKQAELREVPLPEKKEGMLGIDVKYCGVCGSDIEIYLGTHPRAVSGSLQQRPLCRKQFV